MSLPGTRVLGVAVALAMGAGLFAGFVAVTVIGPAALTASQTHAAARAPKLPERKRRSFFSRFRVKAAPSTPESRPEDDKGRFITKSRVCRTTGGRRVCFDKYTVRSKTGRTYMIEREDIWKR